jgi:hypothetical protein
MNRFFSFLRSDLFLSLIGGFALGTAGLALVQPANAQVRAGGSTQSISIEGPSYETAPLNP